MDCAATLSIRALFLVEDRRYYLNVLPLLQPLVLFGQLGPSFVSGLSQVRHLFWMKLAAFLDGAHQIVHLVSVDHPRNRCSHCGIPQNVSDGQPSAPVVFLRVRTVGRTVALEKMIACKRLDAEDTHVVFPDALKEAPRKQLGDLIGTHFSTFCALVVVTFFIPNDSWLTLLGQLGGLGSVRAEDNFHLLDVGNIHDTGFAEQWIEMHGPRITRIHLKDVLKHRGRCGDQSVYTNLFMGDNNWPAIRAAMIKVGYDGWLIAELEAYRYAPDQQFYDTAAAIDRLISGRL